MRTCRNRLSSRLCSTSGGASPHCAGSVAPSRCTWTAAARCAASPPVGAVSRVARSSRSALGSPLPSASTSCACSSERDPSCSTTTRAGAKARTSHGWSPRRCSPHKGSWHASWAAQATVTRTDEPETSTTEPNG